MKKRLKSQRVTLACWFIIALIALACPPLFAASHALLIGIQDYPNTQKFRDRGFQQLSGPRNDVNLIKNILLAPPFEFSKNNMKILLDKDATHTAIEKAFTDLRSRIKPKDFVYIHFSGHGSYHENENPEDDKEVTKYEPGKAAAQWKTYDQTWVTYGSSSGLFPELEKDDRDILDDQINVWLAEIGKITDQIVFVSDSCHSGSVSRGPKMGVRAIGMDVRPYPKEVLAPSSGPPAGIRIGASKDNESAIEITQDGQIYGRFTWFWSKALRVLKPGETWGDIFRRAEALMREEGIDGPGRVAHQPQIMLHKGDQDLTVLGGDFMEPSTRIAVTAIDDHGKRVRLNAGMLSGIANGSYYRIFTGAENTQEGLPEVEVISVTPFSSEAKILKGPIKRGDILVESQHSYQFGPIRIAIESDDALEHNQKQKIIDLIAKQLNSLDSPGLFELVKNRQEEGWIIYLLQPDKAGGKYSYAPNTTLPISKPGAPPEAWVLNMQEELLDDTMRVNLSDLETGVSKLVKKIKILADMRDLKILKNNPPDIVVKAHQLTEDPTCGNSTGNICLKFDTLYRAIDTTELKQLNGKKLPHNSKMGFSVENKTRDSYYLYLLNISARNGAFVQFPPEDRPSEYALIKGGESRILDAGLHFPNSGLEIVKVILSLKPLDPEVFEFAGTNEEKRAAKKGPQNPLERLLNRNARRGESMRAPGPSEWGTIQAQFDVMKEGN